MELGGGERDWGAKREGQERASASSASSVHLMPLHPSLHPAPPLSPTQQLASFHPSRERSLWWRRLRHQCVFKLRTESLNSPWIHTRCLVSRPPLTSVLSSLLSSISSPLFPLTLFFSPPWSFSHPALLPTPPLLLQLSLPSPVSLDQPSSPVLMDLEWRAAEAMRAESPGGSIRTEMERLQHQLDSTESTVASCWVTQANGLFPLICISLMAEMRPWTGHQVRCSDMTRDTNVVPNMTMV